MAIVGAILLIVAVVLFFVSRSKRKQLDDLRGVERRPAGELASLAAEVGAEIGGGSFRERVEIVGKAQCEKPLASPLGNETCLYYTTSVQREYEEEYYENDSQGRQQRRTRRSSESMSQETRSVPFAVVDDSGSLEVIPDGATWDGLVTTVDRFDQGEQPGIELGRLAISLLTGTSGRRTIGYRYNERVMPVGRTLTVIGEASDAMGKVTVRAGEAKKLWISTRSREDLVSSARKTITVLWVLAGVFGVGGLGLLIAGVV